jgi:hypothetical protein
MLMRCSSKAINQRRYTFIYFTTPRRHCFHTNVPPFDLRTEAQTFALSHQVPQCISLLHKIQMDTQELEEYNKKQFTIDMLCELLVQPELTSPSFATIYDFTTRNKLIDHSVLIQLLLEKSVTLNNAIALESILQELKSTKYNSTTVKKILYPVLIRAIELQSSQSMNLYETLISLNCHFDIVEMKRLIKLANNSVIFPLSERIVNSMIEWKITLSKENFAELTRDFSISKHFHPVVKLVEYSINQVQMSQYLEILNDILVTNNYSLLSDMMKQLDNIKHSDLPSEDETFYATVIHAFAELEDTVSAQKWFNQYLSTHEKLSQGTQCINWLLYALCRKKQFSRARVLLKAVDSSHGVTPDEETFDILFRSTNDKSWVTYLLRQMTKYNIRPKIAWFNSVLDTIGNKESAKAVYNYIKNVIQIIPDSQTVTVVAELIEDDSKLIKILYQDTKTYSIKPNAFLAMQFVQHVPEYREHIIQQVMKSEKDALEIHQQYTRAFRWLVEHLRVNSDDRYARVLSRRKSVIKSKLAAKAKKHMWFNDVKLQWKDVKK